MGNNQFRQWSKARETNVDYFDDEQSWEREGLGGTEAAQLTTRVQETLTPDGLLLAFNCPSCARESQIVVEWPEIGFIAHNLIPNMAVNMGRGPMQLSSDPWKQTGPTSFAPVIACKSCQSTDTPSISKTEAERYFIKARENGLCQSDQRYPALIAILSALRVKNGGQPLQP